MPRPYPFRFLPMPLQQSLYQRVYSARHAAWPELFQRAPLALCPAMAMHGLVQGDAISGSIAFTGCYELRLSRRIAAHARAGGLLVDVGANMGYFSLLWAGLGPGEVVAVEPVPRNIALLNNNLKMNDLAGRVTVLPKAAGDRDGEIRFTLPAGAQTGWGGIAGPDSPGDTTVPMFRIDDVLRGREIEVLKVDVEGAEALVLRGCEALLRSRRVGHIYFEQNPSRMRALGLNPGEIPGLLEGFGYEARPLDAAGTEWFARPRR